MHYNSDAVTGWLMSAQQQSHNALDTFAMHIAADAAFTLRLSHPADELILHIAVVQLLEPDLDCCTHGQNQQHRY